MSASFEILSYCYHDDTDYMVGVLRVHPGKGSYKNKDPYTWAATLKVRGSESWVLGILAAPKPSEWRDIYSLVRSIGVSTVCYERAGKKTKTIQIK